MHQRAFSRGVTVLVPPCESGGARPTWPDDERFESLAVDREDAAADAGPSGALPRVFDSGPRAGVQPRSGWSVFRKRASRMVRGRAQNAVR